MILDAWGWCTEMTQRDGTEREEGERIRETKRMIMGVMGCDGTI